MRILFLSSPGPHSNKWVNALCERGHEVFFVMQEDDSLEKLDSRAHVIKLPIKGKMGYYLNAVFLRRIYKKIKPDVVNAHYASGYGTLARVAGLDKTVLSVWGSDVYDFPYKNKLCMFIIRKNLLHAKQIASTSICMAQQVRNLIGDQRKITVTPFGVDVNRFSADRFPHEKKHIITIGNVKTLRPVYGIDDLVRAFSLARKGLMKDSTTIEIARRLRCVIYGGGELKEEIEALIRELDLSGIVTLPGEIPNEMVPEVLSGFDVFCATSHRESFGVSLVEAQAMCLPVVATDTDGFREVIEDGVTGLIVPVGAINQIADAITRLVLDSNLRECMGRAGRERVLSYYSFADNVSTMENIYKSAMEE